MVILREEIKEFSKAMKDNGVVQGPQQPNKSLSTDSLLFNGGNKTIIMENGNMHFNVVGGKGINGFPEATLRTEVTLMDSYLRTPAGEIEIEAGPFVGTKLNKFGTAGIAGGNISFKHIKSGTIVGCEGSISTSSIGNLSSQNTPNAIGSCGLSFKF
jgi:hypothetical protein